MALGFLALEVRVFEHGSSRRGDEALPGELQGYEGYKISGDQRESYGEYGRTWQGYVGIPLRLFGCRCLQIELIVGSLCAAPDEGCWRQVGVHDKDSDLWWLERNEGMRNRYKHNNHVGTT